MNYGCVFVTAQQESEPYILSVDTTTDLRSVAVCLGPRRLAQTAGSLRAVQSASKVMSAGAGVAAAEPVLGRA